MFEGQIIDIAGDWDEATACMVSGEPGNLPECFRTEAEMNARIGDAAAIGTSPSTLSPTKAQSGSGVVLYGTTCAASMRLYSGTSYSGSVLWL
ncbi:MAG: hypothetical protein ACC652_14230, partial [Acidimicrobiales bacterium]